jgi:hypothetical protein
VSFITSLPRRGIERRYCLRPPPGIFCRNALGSKIRKHDMTDAQRSMVAGSRNLLADVSEDSVVAEPSRRE